MSEDEIMKILKEITPDDLLNCWEGGEKEFEAIKTILDLYQEDEEIIKRLNTEYETAQGYILALKKSLEEEKEKNEKLVDKTIQYDKTLEKLQKDTIWKDKIREKIEYATKMMKFYATNEPDHVLIPIYNEVVKVCKELLEEN